MGWDKEKSWACLSTTPSLPFSSHTPQRSGCSSALPYPPSVQGEINRLSRLIKGNIGAFSEQGKSVKDGGEHKVIRRKKKLHISP